MNLINILVNFILFCIFAQLATISHEFGHGIPALLFMKDNVKIIFGNTDRKSKKIKFKRLIIEIGTFQPFLGFAVWNEDMLSKLKNVICYACGPITSLLIAISLIYISGGINNNMLRRLISFSGYYNLWQFIVTAIPIIYPKWWGGYGGFPSDGYGVISAIKEALF